MRTQLRILVAALAVAASATTAGCATVPPVDTGARATSRSDAALRTVRLERAAAPSRTAIAGWYRHVGPKIAKVENAVTRAQHTVHRRDHPGLYAACRVLRTQAEAVEAARQAPDPIARHAFMHEMSNLVDAATSCIANELLMAGHEVNVAHHWSRVADDRVLTLLRRLS